MKLTGCTGSSLGGANHRLAGWCLPRAPIIVVYPTIHISNKHQFRFSILFSKLRPNCWWKSCWICENRKSSTLWLTIRSPDLMVIWSRMSTYFKMMSFLFLPRPSQKTEPIFLFLLNLSNLHNMFRLSPWSHGIWFTTDKNNIDHKKLRPTFTFSRTHWEKMKAGQKWVKNINPSGVEHSLPLSPSSFVLEPLLVENNPLQKGLLSTGARTPPSNCNLLLVTSAMVGGSCGRLGRAAWVQRR